jgi:hypothetical protein
LDGVVRLLANDHSGTDHVDTDLVRTLDNVMILEGVLGIFLLISGGDAKIDPASTVLKLIYKGNEIKKEEKKEEKKNDKEK